MPVVNFALIALSALGFLFQLSLGKSVDGLLKAYGFVPERLANALASADQEALYAALVSVLTSMFLHGGWIHIIGNLLYLRVFGDNVEDRFGHLGFLLFYLASGVAAVLGQYLFDPHSTIPVVGASGCIAGVLGAYIVLFPKARVVTLFPVFIFLTFIEVPAFFFLGIWGLQQLLNGYLVLGQDVEGGVAWFAHIGGFVFGLSAGLWRRTVKR